MTSMHQFSGPPVVLRRPRVGIPSETQGPQAAPPPIHVTRSLYVGDLIDVTDDRTTVGVLTRPAPGAPAAFAPLPEVETPDPGQPLPIQHRQLASALRWQIVHNLGYRPHFDVRDSEGRTHMPMAIEHPVPGVISEIVFGVPMVGTADPS